MNLPYAIRVEGEFSYMKARSVPSQVKPYPKLVEVTDTQPTFKYHDVRGTLVGFRLPSYMEGVNVPGYHFHFLTEDAKAGGHLLELQLDKGRIEIDYLSDFRMELPRTEEFYRLDLTKDMSEDLDKVER
ncbi:MAG: acetolactate decarboxylase [Chloroflexota bacterium]|jgi:acetolactate decarboxylase